MTTILNPPPTYAEPTVVDDKTGKARFNPIWLKWFLDLAQILQTSGIVGGVVVHNSLTGLQGGSSNQFYHMTSAEYTGTGTGAFARQTNAVLSPTSISITSVGGYKSSDGSTGFTGTVTTATLVGKTITIKDGIITNFA